VVLVVLWKVGGLGWCWIGWVEVLEVSFLYGFCFSFGGAFLVGIYCGF